MKLYSKILTGLSLFLSLSLFFGSCSHGDDDEIDDMGDIDTGQTLPIDGLFINFPKDQFRAFEAEISPLRYFTLEGYDTDLKNDRALSIGVRNSVETVDPSKFDDYFEEMLDVLDYTYNYADGFQDNYTNVKYTVSDTVINNINAKVAKFSYIASSFGQSYSNHYMFINPNNNKFYYVITEYPGDTEYKDVLDKVISTMRLK